MICYESRKLNEHEHKYMNHDLESEVIIHALNMWRNYIFFKRFVLMLWKSWCNFVAVVRYLSFVFCGSRHNTIRVKTVYSKSHNTSAKLHHDFSQNLQNLHHDFSTPTSLFIYLIAIHGQTPYYMEKYKNENKNKNEKNKMRKG